MGLLANLPVGMAPGLGLNAYVGFEFLDLDDMSDRPCFGGNGF
jgi:xanthine/uracil/vitamin C permease (AzgA family)